MKPTLTDFRIRLTTFVLREYHNDFIAFINNKSSGVTLSEKLLVESLFVNEIKKGERSSAMRVIQRLEHPWAWAYCLKIYAGKQSNAYQYAASKTEKLRRELDEKLKKKNEMN